MKIAMLGHKRMPSREGGVEVVVTELATRMAALGHDVTVYNRGGHNVAGAQFDARPVSWYQGVHIKTVRTLDVRGLAALTSSFTATKAALADKPDLIHFHAEGPCACIGMARRAGVRTIATIHGLDWQRAKWGKLASTYIRHGESVAAHQADEIIVLSKNMRDYFQQVYGRTTTFIPNGVTLPTLVPAERITTHYGLTQGNYMLYLGRIVPEKGVLRLVEAARKLDSHMKVVIAGGISDSRQYYEQVRQVAGGDPRFVFTGYVQDKELEELYSNAAFYVLPSDLEGMPLSLLEAMSYGRCCLTSDIPECAEVMGDFGITFKHGDTESLRTHLEQLIADSDLCARLGSAARQHVSVANNWDRIVQQTLGVYVGKASL